jgi:cbb3-type cytochrome oxidase subunit 3
MGAVLWSLNIGLLGFVLFEAPLTLIQKLEFLLNIYGSIATNYASFQALTITIFSVLFGFNIATLVYVFRRGQRNVWRSKGSGGSVMFAALGGGCAACGTAVITPLLGALGASASSALVSSIGNIALLIAIALTLYSIYSLGQRAASLQAQEANQQHNNNKEQS